MRSRVVIVACLLLSLMVLSGQSCAPIPNADGTVGTRGPEGPQGPQGPEGADGQLRIYGDGSAGDLVVSANGSLEALVPSGNFQFANLTVDAGITLTVPSGTVLRVDGTATINGTLAVQAFSLGPTTAQNGGSGVFKASAGLGIRGDSAFIRGGGVGGVGITLSEARMILQPNPAAGGGGGAFSFIGGGAGGGLVIVLARQGIIVAGTVNANGGVPPFLADGGGAGGIVILASPTSINVSGGIVARGSNGNAGSAGSGVGGGGGGGGGIIHLLAPTITTAGATLDVSPGAGGAGAAPTSATTRTGGPGGGACGGNGGGGGEVVNAPFNTVDGGQPGTAGHVIETLVNPTALF